MVLTSTIALFVLGVPRFKLFQNARGQPLIHKIVGVGADDAGALSRNAEKAGLFQAYAGPWAALSPGAPRRSRNGNYSRGDWSSAATSST
jgi:hypothetical protein